ncbi:MAG: tetratricopeptide repeat protein [Nitrospinota bacterium]
MPVRFFLTILRLLLGALVLLGALYFLRHNPGEIRVTLIPGRVFRVPVVVVVFGAALLGAIGASLSDVPSRVAGGWRRRRRRRAAQRRQEAEAHYLSGLSALSSGDFHSARRAFRRALRKDPAHQRALLELGNLERRAGNLPAALDLHRRAVHTGEDDLGLIESLAEDFASAGRPDALRALWERARQAGRGESIPLRRLRDYHISQQEWEAALNIQETLLRLPGESRNGDDRRLLANLLSEAGRRCVEAGRTEEGMDFFKKAIRADGDSVPAHVALGDAHRSAGEHHKALRAWSGGFERVPVSVFIQRVLSLLEREDGGKEALQTLRKEARRRPSDGRLRLALAEAYLREGRPADALAELERTPEPEERPQEVHLLRARALMELNDFGRARAELSAPSLGTGGFRCSACGERSAEWTGRCPACGKWGTLDASG